MGFDLQDEAGASLAINAWNWGTVHHLVQLAAVFPDEVWAPLRGNGGAGLEPDEVVQLGRFLASQVLPQLAEGERMLADQSVTAVPDDGTLYRADDAWKSYSLRRDVLVELIEFLQRATGRVTVS
jgi:hypothetical protein